MSVPATHPPLGTETVPGFQEPFPCPIRDSVRNAIDLASPQGFKSIALPLIGAGSGGFNQEQSKSPVLNELDKIDLPMTLKVVIYLQ